MPPLDQLPDDLKDLRYRNSVELTHTRWNSDVALLIGALKSYVSVNPARQTETVHATVPVQLPAPQAASQAAPAKKSSLYPFGIVAGVFLVLLVAVLVFLHFRSSPAPQTSLQTAPAPQASTPAQPAATGAEAALLGKWQNSKEPEGGDDLIQISVVDFGGQIMVEAWGKCAGHLCNWGSRKATLNGAEATTGSWELRNTEQETKLQRSAALSLQPSGDGLQVAIKNHYILANGQNREIYNQFQFTKMP
jgi:hypothetical protein